MGMAGPRELVHPDQPIGVDQGDDLPAFRYVDRGMSTSSAVEGFHARSDRAPMRRVAISSLLGITLEYYDFLLYGKMSALMFGLVFFSQSDPSIATIAAFGTLAAGYVVRPFGGLIFGHFGDKRGRKSILVLTMSMMGVASFLIGLLPTYAAIGVIAPTILVAVRIVQGVVIGGEWGGAVLMVNEHAAPSRRGLWNGLIQMGSALGGLIAAAVVAAVSYLPEDAFLSWGWRLPFLISIILVAIGLYIRLSIPESPVFNKARAEKSSGAGPSVPLLKLLRHPRSLVLACCVGVGPFALTALNSIYMISYAVAIGYQRFEVTTVLLFMGVNAVVTIPAFSALSDRLGRRTVILSGAIGIVVYAWPFYAMVGSGSVPIFFVALMISQVIQSAMFAPLGALLSEVFGTAVRYTGASMGYQLAALIGAGFTPLIASSLLISGPRSWPLIMLAAGCGIVTIFAISQLSETKGSDLAAAS